MYEPTLFLALLLGGMFVLLAYFGSVTMMAPPGQRLIIWGGVRPGWPRAIYTISGLVAAAAMTYLIQYYYRGMPADAEVYGEKVFDAPGPPTRGVYLILGVLSVMLLASAAWPACAYALARKPNATELTVGNYALLTGALFLTSIPAMLQLGWISTMKRAGMTASEKGQHTGAIIAAALFLLHVGLLDNTLFPMLWFRLAQLPSA